MITLPSRVWSPTAYDDKNKPTLWSSRERDAGEQRRFETLQDYFKEIGKELKAA